MRFMRTMMSWFLLTAMLLSLPGGTTGHFVCTLGMAEAGAACPLCHGHATTGGPGPAIGNSCCKFVTGQSTPVSHLSAARVECPVLADQPLRVSDAGLLIAPAHELRAFAGHRAAPRT